MVERLHWTPELVEKFWSGIAATPLDERSFSRTAGHLLVEVIAPLLSRDAAILDYGAGSGHLIGRLLDAGYRAAGFEPAEGRARELARAHEGRPGFLGVINGNSSERFDVLLCVEVVEHILEEEFAATLANMARFLRPGGILIVTTPNDETLDDALVYCPVSNVAFHRWQHVRSFTPESLQAAFQRHGLERAWLGLISFRDESAFHEAIQRRRHPGIARRAVRGVRALLGRSSPDPVDLRALDERTIVLAMRKPA